MIILYSNYSSEMAQIVDKFSLQETFFTERYF